MAKLLEGFCMLTAARDIRTAAANIYASSAPVASASTNANAAMPGMMWVATSSVKAMDGTTSASGSHVKPSASDAATTLIFDRGPSYTTQPHSGATKA